MPSCESTDDNMFSRQSSNQSPQSLSCGVSFKVGQSRIVNQKCNINKLIATAQMRQTAVCKSVNHECTTGHAAVVSAASKSRVRESPVTHRLSRKRGNNHECCAFAQVVSISDLANRLVSLPHETSTKRKGKRLAHTTPAVVHCDS